MPEFYDGAISIIVGGQTLTRYSDLLANVRNDGRHHSIRALVQPDDPKVVEIAQILMQSDDLTKTAQEFVNSFTTYSMEVGDYWATPAETLSPRCPICMNGVIAVGNNRYSEEDATYYCDICGWTGKVTRVGDCDDMSILLCSILRNGIPSNLVYCAFGLWEYRGKTDGHMWVIVEREDGDDLVLESTASPDIRTAGRYIIHGIFNDQYCFAADKGLSEFDLRPAELAPVIGGRH